MCLSKLNTRNYNRLVREAVIRNSTVGSHFIQQTEEGEVFAADNFTEVWGRNPDK